MNTSPHDRAQPHRPGLTVRPLLFSTTGIIAAVLFGSTFGCQAAQRTVDAGEANARKLLEHVEPTGIIAETGARKKTWEAFRQKADEIDVETFNEAVDNLAIVARQVAHRLDTLGNDDLRDMMNDMKSTLSALRQAIEQAQLAEASAAITQTANTLNKQIDLFGISELNSVLVETKLAVRNVQATGTQVQEHVAVTSKDIRVLSNEVAKILRQLPANAFEDSMQDVKTATAQIASISESWPASAAKIEDTLAMVRLGSRIGVGVIALFGCCAIVWLLKNIRSQHRN